MSLPLPLPLKTVRAAALRRRLFLASVVLALLVLAALPLAPGLFQAGCSAAKVLFFALFIILLAQVIFSSAVAVAGWWVLRRGADSCQLSSPDEAAASNLPATAVVMPIYNEDVNRVFQGLRAMYESVQANGAGGEFDFFILSDTSDTNCAVAEEKAWFELCKQVDGFGRIFYRRRRVQLHHKSGNIADFCRRWGANYRYMIVMDADSVMTGSTIVRLVALMEQRPGAGIMQTVTRPIFGESLFQRMEQFSAFTYRPVFAAGASFWQLCDSNYYGHNAIIRLKPFIRHCAMPELPEFGPLGTRILSHDTIEAALMRRAGYEVWQVLDLDGTHEEGPPDLLESLKRDRRWCHGNLQHIWFLFERGLKSVSRFNILTGILAYGNSVLWLLSLILGVVVAAQVERSPAGGTLGSGVVPAILYVCIMAVLFLPKILGALLIMQSPEKLSLYGGRGKVALSVAAETVYSMLVAPILMLFYTRFVVASCCGIKVGWGAQTRSGDSEPGWRAWFDLHGVNMAIALGAMSLVLRKIPSMLPWLTPVLAGPILAIWISRLSASHALGRRTRAAGWFVTPEEIHPPVELEKMAEPFILPAQPFFRSAEYASDYGLMQAILDPYINAIHVSLLRQRPEAGLRTRDYMAMLADRLLLDGPLILTAGEKRTLLWDADAMLAMHQKLWSSPASHLHEWWQAAFRNYVESSALSIRRTINR